MKMKNALALLLSCVLTLALATPTVFAGTVNADPLDDGVNVIYTVQKGDTLWKLAKANGVSLNQIIQWNPQIKNPNRIYVGDKIVVGHKAAQPDPTPTPAPKEAADLVLKNGTIQTMVSEQDTAQAVAIKGGKIVYVGTDSGVADYVGNNTHVIDLAGKYVTPGFTDGHIHYPTPYLTAETELDLMPYGADLDAYKKALKEFVAAHPDFEIYLSGAMDLKAFPNSVPTKDWLDEICSDKPICITDLSHHGRLLNSKAIELCGITKETPDPAKGKIYKDASGELTGYFSDCNLFDDLPSMTYTDEQYINAFLEFQKEANSYGITALDSGGDEMKPEWYNRLYQEGKLNLRINYNFFNGAPLNAQKAIDYIQSQKKYESPFLNIRQVKFSLDGVPEGKTSYLLEPYAEGAGMEKDYRGSAATTQEDLNQFTAKINAAGYTVQIHAMGDASVRMSLEANEYSIAQNGKMDVRNKITHMNLIKPEDVSRVAKNNIIAAMQPMWFYYDPFFSPLEEQMLGKERFQSEYHIKDLIDAGIVITGSLDYPITLDFAPLHGIEAGATQCSPYAGQDHDVETYTRNADQAVSVYEMLKMYTSNGAYAAFMDDRSGTIQVGKQADLVVLGQNLLTCDVKSISDTEVVYTISDGRIVYSSTEG